MDLDFIGGLITLFTLFVPLVASCIIWMFIVIKKQSKKDKECNDLLEKIFYHLMVLCQRADINCKSLKDIFDILKKHDDDDISFEKLDK